MSSLPHFQPSIPSLRPPAELRAQSHLSEVLFWPDATCLLGSPGRIVAAEGGETNSQASASIQTLVCQCGREGPVAPGLAPSQPSVLSSFPEQVGWDPPENSFCLFSSVAEGRPWERSEGRLKEKHRARNMRGGGGRNPRGCREGNRGGASRPRMLELVLRGVE